MIKDACVGGREGDYPTEERRGEGRETDGVRVLLPSTEAMLDLETADDLDTLDRDRFAVSAAALSGPPYR